MSSMWKTIFTKSDSELPYKGVSWGDKDESEVWLLWISCNKKRKSISTFSKDAQGHRHRNFQRENEGMNESRKIQIFSVIVAAFLLSKDGYAAVALYARNQTNYDKSKVDLKKK